ncbi:MAG: hypothetical protein DHS20C15_00500 [Planctomycetota bacterium]|nr:MAG: hypothetical protein DHS20C15_00500 [Planctomycetota bacterium]
MSLSLLLGLALFASPVDDLTARLDEVLFRMADAEPARTWELARQLREAARRDTIASVPHLITAAENASPDVKLVLGSTLLDLEAEHEAAALLLPLIEGEHGLRVLEILADRSFRDVPEVGARLEELMQAPIAPLRRIAVARTAFRALRGNTTRFEALDLLVGALESDNAEVRAEAALALGELGHFEQAGSVLRDLSAEPGPRGKLASAYLDLDLANAYHQRQLERLRSQAPARSGNSAGGQSWSKEAFNSGPGSLDILEELIDLAQRHHLLGEELGGAEGREHLIAAAAKGMLATLDEHSTYFSSSEFENWLLSLRRNYAGIGAYVDTINSVFTITRPIYSGPAYQAGLLSGDQIHKVDGWDTYNEPNDEIIRRLKGEPGTEVTIQVYRRGWQKARDFVIERDAIHIDSVNWAMLPGNIGHIEVLTFGENTSRELATAINEMRDQNVEGILLDLRNNSGGYLQEAVRICSLFLDPGELLVYTEGRASPREEFRSRRLDTLPDGPYEGPLVVLVNSRSASASEIVSGALQKAGRARVVGTKTFGKGSVQQPMPVTTRPGERFVDSNGNQNYDPGEQYQDDDGNGKFSFPVQVKLTTARYFLADGTSLHTERDIDGRVVSVGGVEPDIEVEFEGLESWENNELAELFDSLEGKNPFEDYVAEHWDADPELFRQLAMGDDHDTSRYPDFDEFRGKLDTALSDDTLRLLIRAEVRDRVADERGQAYPGGVLYGDWQEDAQLQRAIAAVANEMSLDLMAYEAYDDFAPDAR